MSQLYKNILTLANNIGINIEKVDKMGNTLLMIKLMSKEELIQKFMKNTNINHKNYYKGTPLHIAIKYKNSYDVIQLLLNNGASISINNIYGYTPVLEAIYNKNYDIIKLLLSYDLSTINKVDFCGRTPLMYALSNKCEINIIKMLINYGSDINKKDINGIPPLSYALNCFNNLEIIQLLLDNGADINNKYVFENTINNTKEIIYIMLKYDLFISDEKIKKIKNAETKYLIEEYYNHTRVLK
jgi:ankyrin repeat protein